MDISSDDSDLQSRIIIRVGKRFKDKYTQYLNSHDITGASFTRNALEYWMEVDGKPESLSNELIAAQKDIKHLQSLLIEKERTISILQEQIQWLTASRGHVQVSNNKNSHITAVAEREPPYYRENDKN